MASAQTLASGYAAITERQRDRAAEDVDLSAPTTDTIGCLSAGRALQVASGETRSSPCATRMERAELRLRS